MTVPAPFRTPWALLPLLLAVALAPGAARAQDAATRAREAAEAASRAADEAERAAAAAREAAGRKAPAAQPAAEPASTPAAADAPEAPGSADDLTRQAVEAARLAAEAAARVAGLAERAMDRADRAEGVAPAAAAAPAQGSGGASQADLDRAIQSAEEAAAAAREAARAARAAAREMEEEERIRFARRAITLGGHAFYAPEDFDAANGVNVNSSKGLSATVGWRIFPRFAIEARGDYFDGFDYQSKKVEGKVDGFAITGNFKLYPLIGRFQPYLVTGFGAIHAEVTQRRFSDGDKSTDSRTEVTGRVGAGIDLVLTETIAFEVEASYNGAGGDLDFMDYGLLSAGLQFRLH